MPHFLRKLGNYILAGTLLVIGLGLAIVGTGANTWRSWFCTKLAVDNGIPFQDSSAYIVRHITFENVCGFGHFFSAFALFMSGVILITIACSASNARIHPVLTPKHT